MFLQLYLWLWYKLEDNSPFAISRWDIQHMRAIQAHQSLEKKHRDREEARLRGKKSGCTEQESKDIESFLPPPEDGRGLQCL